MQENNKEITIQDVISKKKETSKRVDTKLIIKAYNYAVEHHGDQKRRSGEPYSSQQCTERCAVAENRS